MKATLLNSDYSGGQLLNSVLAILESNELCCMATVTPSGESHIHTAYFCYNGALDIYFVSDSGSRHCQNLLHTPSAAVAVFDTRQPWDTPHRGLQFFGKCRIAGVAESVKALAIHAARFHAYGDYIKALSPFERDSSPFKFYLFRPESVKILDEPAFGEEKFIVAEVHQG